MTEATLDTQATSCRECKYIFVFAFALLFAFFIVTYIFREDNTATAFPKPTDREQSVDGTRWQERLNELKNTSEGKFYPSATNTTAS